MRRLAWSVVIAMLALAVLADFVASDRPIVMSRDGARSWFVNLDDAAPRGEAIAATLGPDDWALWAPVRHDAREVRTAGELAILQAPSSRHWLGTDDRGRDVLARLIHGARTTAQVAALAAALALLLGVGLALASARVGGAPGRIVLIGCDAIAAAPPVLTVIAAQGLAGARGVLAMAVLIGVPRAADTARLVAASLRRALAEPFTEAARAAGAGPGRVLLRHALPLAAPVLAAATALTAATAVLSEAALAFLGAGAAPPTPSWGELLAQASIHELRWWLAAPAGLLITAVTAALFALARPR